VKRVGLGVLGSVWAMNAFAGLADATNALNEIKSWLFTLRSTASADDASDTRLSFLY
jgi:hypothetical protein